VKYQHAIHQQIRRRFHDTNVRVSSSATIDDEKPIRPVADGHDWKVIERYCSQIQSCEWTLDAETEDALDQAHTLINEALEKARRAKFIGFLILPDRSKFGLIVGRGGETVKKLQDETNTTVVIPRNAEDDNTIEITGMSWHYRHLDVG
jgi:hypothetical protein